MVAFIDIIFAVKGDSVTLLVTFLICWGFMLPRSHSNYTPAPRTLDISYLVQSQDYNLAFALEFLKNGISVIGGGEFIQKLKGKLKT